LCVTLERGLTLVLSVIEWNGAPIRASTVLAGFNERGEGQLVRRTRSLFKKGSGAKERRA